jgi:hypothetical protein
VTSYPNQFLYLGDADGCPHEVVNGARAAYNIESAGVATGRFANVLENMGCDALAWQPMCVFNLLDRETSTLKSSTGDWSADTNVNLSWSTAIDGLEGVGVLRMQAPGNGDMWAAGSGTGTSGAPVVEGQEYTLVGSLRSAATSRSFELSVDWYDAVGTLISWDGTGTSASSTSGWTTISANVTAPAGAAFGRFYVSVYSAVTSEIHYVDRCGFLVATDGLEMPWVEGVDGNDGVIGWGQWITYDTADPWDNGAAAAAEAFGVIIEEWTGLDGGHHTRSQAATGINRGGARFGPQTNRARTMKINALLVGSSERGLNHLFRWLERELLDPGEPCANRAMWVRDVCPDVTEATDDELEVGWYYLNRVALVEGPTWEAEPTKNAGCYIRRVSFTLVAGDPCMYSTGSDVHEVNADTTGITWDSGLTVAGCDEWDGTDVSVFAEINPGDNGNLAPRITIWSTAMYDVGDRIGLPDLRIFGLVSPEIGTATPCTAEKLGELVISPFDATGAMIVIDFASRTIMYRDPVEGSDWQDGSRFLVPGSPGAQRRWWDFGARTGVVYVEPLYEGLANSVDGSAQDTGGGGDWFVRIEAVQRVGCA